MSKLSQKEEKELKSFIKDWLKSHGLNQKEISLRTFDYHKLDPKSRKGFPIRLNHYQTDISKIKRDLEWLPTFDLLNGLKDSFVKDFNNKKSEKFDESSDHILFNS